jgi:hypothetical protein
MFMLVPETVASDMLISTNVPENDHAEWNAGANFGVGARVMIAAQHVRYEALKASTGVNPATDDGTTWLKLGATNRWRAFDQILSDPVKHADVIEYELQPEALCTAVSLFGLQGVSVRLVVTDPAEGVVYDRTVSLQYLDGILDWYSYFFTQAETETEALFTDIPPYPSATFRIRIENTGGIAEVGQICLGQTYEVGETDVGTQISVEDYSRKERDAFGRSVLVERAYAQVVDFDFTIPTARARYVQRLIANRRARPTVYFAAPDRPDLGTLVYGISGALQVNLTTPTFSTATLEVEGLV